MTSVVPQNQNRCVFVGNIPYDATEEHLIQICEEVGPVVSFRLVVDKETGKPKGYGFCEYKDEETALSARRNLQSYEINGRQLRVDFAENGKNVDRNRDQGRGGPGAGTDGQKQLAGNSNMKESMTQQPLGIPSAASASSVMSGVLGGSLNGLASQPGPDPLTNYLARMSRPQLMAILSEIKLLATQNMGVARQLLERNPQLLKALFQAEIMLGLATPQAIQQIGSNSRPPPHHGQSQLPPNPVAPSIRPLVPQNPNLVAPSQNPNLVAPLQNPNVPPPPIMQQNARPTYEVGTVPNQRPPPVPASVPSSSMQQSFHARPPSQVVRKQAKQWSETTRPSKQRRLDQPVPQNAPPVNPLLAQTQPQPQKPTQQISPEVESVLLQQVLSLTPDQLSSLPVEQQQQVLHLQKMLSSSSR